MTRRPILLPVLAALLCPLTATAAPSEAAQSARDAAREYGAAVRNCDLAWALDFMYPPVRRTLADRPVRRALPIVRDGKLLNDPHNPYWGRYEGDEDTRRKPAYHNGTGWTLPFPLYAEALFRLYGEPARPIARAILASAEHLVNQDCVTQLPECVMGDAPHEPCGTGAQAWGVSELLRVLTLVEPQEEA